MFGVENFGANLRQHALDYLYIVVTLMYPIGVVTAYFGHVRYSFAYGGRMSPSIVRYAIAHLIGYGVCIGMLYLFSDRLGYPHQLVQAVNIFVVAGILYLLFRYFVFPNSPLIVLSFS
jgi:putative flippase GtrA